MSSLKRRVLFALFFLSGFSGLVYQVVWTRIAFAHFGIITPVLSVVISVFMAGLSVGSWAGGRSIGTLVRKTGASAAVFYALAELAVGLGAFGVPQFFRLGDRLLLAAGQSNSLAYLSLSALVLAVSILPSCLCMGTTFPWMMAYVREEDPRNSDSFSFLYLANVLGALSGTLISALLLVEILGFRSTLAVAATANFTIAGVALWLGRKRPVPSPEAAPVPAARADPHCPGVWATTRPNRSRLCSLSSSGGEGWGEEASFRMSSKLGASGADPGVLSPKEARLTKWILFSTGFASMGMEVIWTRAFAPVLKTQVYSFASIVAAYLAATFLGSLLYRRHLRANRRCSVPELLAVLCACAFLPVVANDARLTQADLSYTPGLVSVLFLLGSICPFCAVLGYLTPRLVDDFSAGSPAAAGRAYAINVLGCILGPLFACYILLPAFAERHALVLFSLPFVAFSLLTCRSLPRAQRALLGSITAALLLVSLFVSRSCEDQILRSGKRAEVRRDHSASVLAFGQDRKKSLLVNGIGMTSLIPETKFMAHLPLAFHVPSPQKALIICFGMGTTYRSSLSWNIDTTAVELVPSVRDAFTFFFSDAPLVLSNPKGRIIIDDGRRFLKRTHERYDVIVVDPPPPAEAAGSSLLYSTEFYSLAAEHLMPQGILETWLYGDERTATAELRSLCESFRHVRCFCSIAGLGVHALASQEPIQQHSPQELAAAMPAAAKTDLLEWAQGEDLVRYLARVSLQEVPPEKPLALFPGDRITDDQPFNEYFILRDLNL